MIRVETLSFLIMASAALAYELAFLEDLDPNVENFDPDRVIWNEYNSGVGCTAIPPNNSEYVQEIIIRIPPNELDPPALMVFFDNGAQEGSPIQRPSCNIEDIVFIVHWYELPNSQQLHYPIDGSITHFSEVRRWSNLEQFIEGLENRTRFVHEGDVLLRNRENDVAQEWEVIKDDVEFSIPYIPRGSQESSHDSVSQSTGAMEAESIEEPGTPLRLDSDLIDPQVALNNQPNWGSISSQVEIEEALGSNQSGGGGGDEIDLFEEMYNFERSNPNFWVYLVQQLVQHRDAAMAAGVYYPVPLGLHNRYSEEELTALGLNINPALEGNALRVLADLKIQNPDAYNSLLPSEYQIFTGYYPGIWNQLSQGDRWRAAHGNGNAEMSEISLGAAGLQRSASQSVGHISDVLSNGQMMQPEAAISHDLGDRRAIGIESSLEQEEDLPPRNVRLEDENIDPNAECLIQDICIEDTS
ncbi:hypothetical protein TWF506_009729 [Arthrobotrys conoides]|uniref:Uncharacterized protein n=1 Tax=Arthrobotrys conoides TaxID=74498 RepID=A0AAN8RWK5_9PEZI